MTTICIWNRWVSFSVQVRNEEFTGSTNRCLGRLHIMPVHFTPNARAQIHTFSLVRP